MNLKRILTAWILTGIAFLATPSVYAGLLVSSYNNNEILSYNQTTGAFEGVFASGGPLVNPDGMAFGPDGDLYVASRGSNQILRYSGSTGVFLGVFVSSISVPASLVFGPNGNLFVSSYGNQGVEEFNGQTGANMGLFAAGHGLTTPAGVGFGPDGNLYVSNYQQFSTGNVLQFNGATGAFISTFIPTGVGGLSDPTGLVFGPTGNLYVSDYFDKVVRGYNGQTGAPLGFVTSGGPDPTRAYSVEIGPNGNVFMSTGAPQSGPGVNSAIFQYNSQTGAYIDSFVPPGSGGLDGATGFAFTPSSVPEPTSLTLLVISAVGLATHGCCQRKKAKE